MKAKVKEFIIITKQNQNQELPDKDNKKKDADPKYKLGKQHVTI